MNYALEDILSLASNADFHQRFCLIRDAPAGNWPYAKTVQLIHNKKLSKF